MNKNPETYAVKVTPNWSHTGLEHVHKLAVLSVHLSFTLTACHSALVSLHITLLIFSGIIIAFCITATSSQITKHTLFYLF